MKKSIRTRITLIFVGLMALMLLSIWGVNAFWLEPYYTDQKIKIMEYAYDNIDQAIMDRVNAGEAVDDVISQELSREWEIFSQIVKERREDKESDSKPSKESARKEYLPKGETQDLLSDELREELSNSLVGTMRRYSDQNNIAIILVDSATGKTMLNFGRSSDFLAQHLQQYVLGQGEADESHLLSKHDNYIIEKNVEPRSGSRYLESWGYFSDNNTLFMMRMPLASIQESVMLSNRFIGYVGIAMLILGSIVMYFVTRRVTEPILSLAALSERMSKLDFEASYEGDAEDEIGILGHSMNTMSIRLKDTISELQEANVQLQKDIQEKIEIDDMRKEFIANVSHELKTPIALIQGYAEGLTEGMAEDAESRNYYCEVIMDEANKMNKLVKQLLTLTALEFGNDVPNLEVFDLKELIQDLLNSSAILIDQNQANVDFICPDHILVKADEFKIEEVITNYLSNAIHHLGKDRRVIIRVDEVGVRTDTKQEMAADRQMNSSEAGKTGQKGCSLIKVTVYNSGDLIPEEALANLWTKFYKVDKARTRTYGGSGIGLSIVKAIMDAHHQEYGVRNEADGVSFWFTLERAEQM